MVKDDRRHTYTSMLTSVLSQTVKICLISANDNIKQQ